MSSSSKICRDLIDTKDVIKAQLSEVLAKELVGDEKISRDECKTVLAKLSQCIDKQVDGLIDRIVNEFQ